jgi:adenine-specific DNA-methyltransferase
MKDILTRNAAVTASAEFIDRLRKAFPECFDRAGVFLRDKFDAAFRESGAQEAREGYRLGFVGKDYARLIAGRESERVIAPDMRHNAKLENAASGNVFITGDNLDALRLLQSAYSGKIKMIYIDPPYNTGKEFVYNDNFVMTDEDLRESLGYGDDEIARLRNLQGKSSHSAWLTFMYPRLKLAQRLLRDDGVIFISIDDNEQANLKLLMDDIFGEGNFVADFIRKTKSMTGDEGTGVNIQHENLICFARYKEFLFLQGDEKTFDGYANPDNDTNGDWISGDPSAKSGGASTYFPIKNPFTGREDFPPRGRFWAFSQQTRDEYILKGKIKFKENYKNNERGFIFKRYKNELGTNYNPANTLGLTENDYMNSVGTTEIYDLFNGNFFDNPKPVSLIKHLLKLSTKLVTDSPDIILDFFAGSGTTAHAVMELNAEDGGNRQFIVVQIDEPSNPDSEARKAGFNTIDEIARERIKRAAAKRAGENPSASIQGFKHYRLISPSAQTLDKIRDFDPSADLILDDMLAPFADPLSGASGYDAILATWLLRDGNAFTTPVQKINFAGYEADYVESPGCVYLINEGWTSSASQALLNKIGTNEITARTIVIYPYSFSFEILRELKINLKNNLDGEHRAELVERF